MLAEWWAGPRWWPRWWPYHGISSLRSGVVNIMAFNFPSCTGFRLPLFFLIKKNGDMLGDFDGLIHPDCRFSSRNSSSSRHFCSFTISRPSSSPTPQMISTTSGVAVRGGSYPMLSFLLLSWLGIVTLKTFSMFDICILAGQYQGRKKRKISQKNTVQ